MDRPSHSASNPKIRRRGRGWAYVDGYLLNEYLGRVGHTPSWVVEVEGASFTVTRPLNVWRSILSFRQRPRIIQRNRRRVAFAWPLLWPPPDAQERARMAAAALDRARELGTPTGPGCGVCALPWEGGPSLLDGRARHLCPDCAEAIRSARAGRPPSALATWLWCGVAGFAGLLFQLLFHVSWGWTALPLALVAGWLMGTANGPNFERHPIVSPFATIALVLLFQVVGWSFIFSSELGTDQSDVLASVMIWTILSLPPAVLLSWSLGTMGVLLALVERRLKRP